MVAWSPPKTLADPHSLPSKIAKSPSPANVISEAPRPRTEEEVIEAEAEAVVRAAVVLVCIYYEARRTNATAQLGRAVVRGICTCRVCADKDCDVCRECLNKPRNGGNGLRKQKCVWKATRCIRKATPHKRRRRGFKASLKK